MKKIIALLACLAMLLSMAACAKTTPDADPTDAPTNAVTEVPTEEGTEEATEEVTDEVVEDPTDAPVAMEGTVGENLLAAFKANPNGTAEEIANNVIANPVIQFGPMVMPIEAGLLMGFGETEITGFEEGAVFAPMIGTIPFMGYIFKLADGADVEAFKTLLKENADLRWNICTAAEELVVENEGNTVFFLMCPTTFEQPDMGGDVGGMDLPIEDGDGIVLG